jgi:cob(I)alamin adenosyltransferase
MSVTINRVYTKVGDRGETHLVGGHPVPKDSTRISAYGTVDELNACLGLCRRANVEEKGPDEPLARIDVVLARVQSELFNLGSLMATLPKDLAATQPRIETRHIEALEHEIDEWNATLPALRSFTLPGGGWVSSFLHLARTVCRRAEREATTLVRGEAPELADALRYLNRLSDWLYVLGRWNVRQRQESEPLWQPEKT